MTNLQGLKNALSKKGFDITVLFSSSVYNDYLSSKGLSQYNLPDHDAKCMLVGNTKKLWSSFITESNGQTLDSWTASEIFKITNGCVHKPFSIYFVFDDYLIVTDRVEKGKKRIAFQTLGQSIGFSFAIPGTGLSVSREFGPWFAFRAVLVFHDELYKESDHDVGLVEKWIHQCITADQLKYFTQKTNDALSKKDSEKELIEIRKEIGILLKKEDYEYGFNQMMYHYTKSKEYLKI